MGVEIKLSDRELPVSPIFVDFLLNTVKDIPFEGAKWGDQLSEELNTDQRDILKQASENAQAVMSTEFGQQQIARSYELFIALLTGDIRKIKDIQLKFHFINIIGVPRNGGSYLTKGIYSSLGYDPAKVPNVIAHDGFPEAGPFRFDDGLNSWTASLQTMAEFLTMVEIYFANATPHTGKIIVPKKLTKGTYAGGFFHRILGESVEHIITIRHPVTSCISTYEKSGGLPENGCFSVRGNIEEWVRRDLMYTGISATAIEKMDYFDAYLKYWEQYQTYVATTGLSANRHVKVVAYGKERLMDVVRDYGYRFGNRNPQPEDFKVFDKRDRHSDWFTKAEASVKRIHELWNRMGLKVSLDEIMEAW